MAVRRSLSCSKPLLTSVRNWWSGEPRRVGSSSCASRDASPSKKVPSRLRIRPMAESRRSSSNSSRVKLRSWPRSPRKASRVRGRRPSPSAKFVRSTSSTWVATRSLSVSAWRIDGLELAAHDVHVERGAGILQRDEPDAQGPAHERGPLLRRTAPHEGGQPGIDEAEVPDDEPVRGDADAFAVGCRRGQLDDGGAFHAAMMCGARASSRGTHPATLSGVRVVIAHGASGTAASMQRHVAGLAERGVAAIAIDLPVRLAETAVPIYRARIEALPDPPAQLVIGGQSYGGRVASLLAAERDSGIAGLVCFSYPLHRPGQPDWQARTGHWPRHPGARCCCSPGRPTRSRGSTCCGAPSRSGSRAPGW